MPTSSLTLINALTLPAGARFYRCALQINPFGYLQRHQKPTSFTSEQTYNEAVIASCITHGIEVIGVTDHYRVKDSFGLVVSARKAGLIAFGGFEAVTKDGVHFLCLFDSDLDDRLERFIGECGIHDERELSPIGTLDSEQLMERARRWGGMCIAAHVAADGGGLLKVLSGQSRIKVWTSPNLLACSLPGRIEDAPEAIRPILENKDGQHRRERLPAILNAQDANDPADIAKTGSSCFIKMSAPTIEALRQAFLDPDSRVRLSSDPSPTNHTELLAVTWEGGFLADAAVHLNPNLNVLIGGRGAGKSTVIESVRYVLGLEPLGEDARKLHDGVIKHVLRSGTKISLLIKSYEPSLKHYTIERTVPNPPVVKDSDGSVLELRPGDVMPGIETYGQHELSELTKSPEKLTRLLERFIDRDNTLPSRKLTLQQRLTRSRTERNGLARELGDITERLAELPRLEETLRRYKAAGLDAKLRTKSLVMQEERLFEHFQEQVSRVREFHQTLSEAVPLDTAFVSPDAIKELPNVDVVGGLEMVLNDLNAQLSLCASQMAQHINDALNRVADIRTNWEILRRGADTEYEKLLRDLQKENVDGDEFIKLQRRVAALRPLLNTRDGLRVRLAQNEKQRTQLLDEWENIKAEDYRNVEKAAKKVSRKLKGHVRVEVTMAGSMDPLDALLRERIGGNLSAALDRLHECSPLSLPELAARCREGKSALMEHFSLPTAAAERLAQADSDVFMHIEELELPATTKIELNTSSEKDAANWKALGELSTGQKATAVLLLLLLESEAPLIVDQPEDDLDNRFITEVVVPIMRQEKRRRQFIFSTHNANIPVLGDAEMIVGLGAAGEAGGGKAIMGVEHRGSIDNRVVRELVEEILEGGKAAFEMRRLKYGF